MTVGLHLGFYTNAVIGYVEPIRELLPPLPQSPQKLTSLLPVEQRILLSTAISCLERIPRLLLQDSTLGFTVAPHYSSASSSVTHPV